MLPLMPRKEPILMISWGRISNSPTSDSSTENLKACVCLHASIPNTDYTTCRPRRRGLKKVTKPPSNNDTPTRQVSRLEGGISGRCGIFVRSVSSFSLSQTLHYCTLSVLVAFQKSASCNSAQQHQIAVTCLLKSWQVIIQAPCRVSRCREAMRLS